MTLRIILVAQHQLQTKKNNSHLLSLPSIEIWPNANASNPHHISLIDISVSGTPEALAVQIQSAYRGFKGGMTKLLPLPTISRLKQFDCKWDEPLPSDVNCTLQVKVNYFDSDQNGNPNVSGVLKEVISKCNIFTPSEQQTVIPPEVETLESPATKQPEVETPEPPATKQPPKEQPNIVTDDLVSKPPNNHQEATGWIAIDFGTSNSTVSLYERKLIVTPNPWFSEPEKRLNDLLEEWLTQSPANNPPTVSPSNWQREWEKFFRELRINFKSFDSSNSETFQQFQKENLLEFIRQIEITLQTNQDWFRRAASQKLNQIYHEVFSIPLLDWQSIIPVELDRDRRLNEIPSELELISLDPNLPENDLAKVKINLGHQAKQNRLEAIQSGQNIEGRFLHSPKRYFGLDRSFEITINGKKDTIKVNKLLQAAYAQLLQLTEDYRKQDPNKFTQGKVYQAVVTYPTVASSFLRQEVESLVRKLDIEDVQMAYDEAVSVAIFYLWKKFNGDLNVGIESFKTRCRSDGNIWWQNVLVLDIGGGTTDLALIRLTLAEIDPFEPGEDRGYGGRYYKITPKLLGSSGHLQLGGELLTLQIFRLLKVAIADCLLTAVAEERLGKDVLTIQQNELFPRFLKDGKFQTGTLLACVDTENRDEEAYQEALKDADRVLATRWKNRNNPSLVQTFYTLWEEAEKAKLILGQKLPKDMPEPLFVLEGQKIAQLFKQNSIDLPDELIDSLKVTLTVEQFQKAVKENIKEAVGIAKGLVENNFKNQPSSTNGSQKTNEQKEQLDWLILSGKTCNIELLQQQLYQEFSQSEYFIWNEERITFELEYTKLATSAGACLAEKYRQLSFAPEEAKPLLRKGANQLYFDIKNLFFFLSCSFTREVLGEDLPIFLTGQELYQLEDSDTPFAKRRSEWLGIQLTNNIRRKDFEGIKPQFWGGYNGLALMRKLEMKEPDFLATIKVQFEINQILNIDLLLCRNNPHYLIPVDSPRLDVAKVIETSPVISLEGKVICDIAVNVAESATALRTDDHTVLFSAEEDYSKQLRVFRDNDGDMKEQGKGLIAELPPFPLSGQHTFYFQFRNLQSSQWELIGELPQPKVTPKYPAKYYVSLNEQGILVVHLFQVPYWTSTSLESLKQEGCVFRDTLQPPEEKSEQERNPFSGEH